VVRTVARSRTRRLAVRLLAWAVVTAVGVVIVVAATGGNHQAHVPVPAVLVIAAGAVLLPVAVLDYLGTPAAAAVRHMAAAPGMPVRVVTVRRRYQWNRPEPAGVVFSCTDPARPGSPARSFHIAEAHGDLWALASLVGVPGVFAYWRGEGTPAVVLCEPRGGVEVHGVAPGGHGPLRSDRVPVN